MTLEELRKQNRPTIFENFGKAVSSVTDGKTTEQLEADLATGNALLARLQTAMNANQERRASLTTGASDAATLDEEHASLVRQHGEVALIVAVLTVELDHRRTTSTDAPD
jgi:hypothetical protein